MSLYLFAKTQKLLASTGDTHGLSGEWQKLLSKFCLKKKKKNPRKKKWFEDVVSDKTLIQPAETHLPGRSMSRSVFKRTLDTENFLSNN